MAHDTRATGVGTGAGTVNMNMSGNSSLTVTAASQDNPGTSRDGKTRGQYTPKEGFKKLPNTENIYICSDEPFREGATVYPGYKTLGTEELPVAIKVIHNYTDDNFKEVTHLKNLGGHPNVVQITDVAIVRHEEYLIKNIYIVMELCSKSLQSFLDDKLSKGDPLDLKQAMSFAWQLVKGIKHIHSHNVSHGDIKPENILISTYGHCIKVSDFGISKVLRHGRSTKPNGGIGTDGYRAPEIYKRETISKESDIYSLGLTLASIFSHGKHLHGDDLDEANSRIKKNEAPNYSVLMVKSRKGEQLKSLLGRMLHFERSKRITIEDVERDPFWIENSPSLDQATFGDTKPQTTCGMEESVLAEQPSVSEEILAPTFDDTKPQTTYDTEESLLAERPSVSEEILDFSSGPVHPASETNPPHQQKTTEESTSEEPSRTPDILSATSGAKDTVCSDPPTNAGISVNAFEQRTAIANPSRMLGVPQVASGAISQDFSAPQLPAAIEERQISVFERMATSKVSSQVFYNSSPDFQPRFKVPSIPVLPASETNPPGQQKTTEESTSEEPSRAPDILSVSSGPVLPVSETNPPDQQKATEESTSEEPSRTPNILSATSGATVCSDPPTNNDAKTPANAFKQQKVSKRRATGNPSRILGFPQAGSPATNPILTDHPNNFAAMESLNPPDQRKLTKELASLDVSQDTFAVASGAISQDFSAPLLTAANKGRQISSCEGMAPSKLSSLIYGTLPPVFQSCFKGPISPVEGGSPNSNSIHRPGFEETESGVKPSLFISTDGNLCLILRTGNALQNDPHRPFIRASIMLEDFHVKEMEEVPISISCEEPKGYTVEPMMYSFVADEKFARVGERKMSFFITPPHFPTNIKLRCRIGTDEYIFRQNIPVPQSRNPKLEDSSAGKLTIKGSSIENVSIVSPQ